MPGGRTPIGGGAVVPGSVTWAGAGGRSRSGGGAVTAGGAVGGRMLGLGGTVGGRWLAIGGTVGERRPSGGTVGGLIGGSVAARLRAAGASTIGCRMMS